MKIDFFHDVVQLPERVAKLRLMWLDVSDDGFFGTPLGQVHIDDSPLCRNALAAEEMTREAATAPRGGRRTRR